MTTPQRFLNLGLFLHLSFVRVRLLYRISLWPGSGKTHTMGTGQSVGEGSEEEGIVPKATVMQVLKTVRGSS